MAKQRALLGGKLLNPCDYLAAIEMSGDLTLTIAAVQHENLWLEGQREPETKPTLSFKETAKRLVLNRTNEDSVCRLHGNVAENWVGKRVTLYRATTRQGRDPAVPCIRIRDKIETEPAIGAKNADKILLRLKNRNSDVSELMAALDPVPTSDDISTWPKTYVAQIQEFLSREPTTPDSDAPAVRGQ